MSFDAGPACPDRNIIAIYDLDRTLTRRATFTPFLMFAARRERPWRLMLLPAWIAAMAAHKLGFCSRKRLKAFGLRLFVGCRMEAARAERLARDFADRIDAGGYQPGALRRLAADRADGATLLLATAAPEFYAREIAARLGFDACLASVHARDASGGYLANIAGENNYGAEKARRVSAWLADRKLARADVEMRVYSDHASDRPLFDLADRAFLVGGAGGRAPAGCERLDWRV